MMRESTRKGRGRRRAPVRGEGRGALWRAALLRAAVFALLWWALAGGNGGAPFAVVFVVLAVGASLALAPPGRALRVVALLRFVPFFLAASLRGGIDVARRTLDPRLRIAPALCDFRLRIAGERERVLVASVVSLMPGSVSAALEGERLRLHVLDRALANERVLRDVEDHVAAIFGQRLARPSNRRARGRRSGRA